MIGSGKQQLIAFIGVALIVANLVTNRTAKVGSSSLIGSIVNQNETTSQLTAAHTQIAGLAAEVIVVIALIVIAGLGDNAGTLAVVFAVGLAMLWALTEWGGLGSKGQSASGTSGGWGSLITGIGGVGSDIGHAVRSAAGATS
jgi:hypothetical protein